MAPPAYSHIKIHAQIISSFQQICRQHFTSRAYLRALQPLFCISLGGESPPPYSVGLQRCDQDHALRRQVHVLLQVLLYVAPEEFPTAAAHAMTSLRARSACFLLRQAVAFRWITMPLKVCHRNLGG